MGNRISFLEFKKSLSVFPVFSTVDIYKMFPTMHRRRLHEWAERGQIRPVVRGFYIFSDTPIDGHFMYHVANRIYDPSYISLQSALAWYGLIPEFVPQVTSVSSKKTTVLKTKLGNFAYYSIKESLMFGYDVVSLKDREYPVKIAFPEKAILDLLYLNPQIKGREQFVELRLSADMFQGRIRLETLKQYAFLFVNKSLIKRVDTLCSYIKNA